MTDIQYNTTIMGGPTGFGFSPKASGFYPFGDATDLAGEGGVRVVVWLIQASAWNQTCRSTNDRCEAQASPKGCFLCFCFSPQDFSTEVITLKRGWGGKIKKRKSGGDFLFFVVETKGFEPLTSAMWLQRSKPAGLRLYFRLAMQSNKKFGDLATYWRFFLSLSGVFSGFS